MMARLIFTFLVVLSAIPVSAQDVDSLMRQGKTRLETQDYAGALEFFRQAFERSPDNPEVVFNTGMAANLSGDFDLGVAAFTRFRELVPDEPRGLTKLIQAYQGAGKDREAEAVIDDLRVWWKDGRLDDTVMAEERSFVREQFQAEGYLVMVFEFFEPNFEEREHTWDFCVLKNGKEQVAMYYVMFDQIASADIVAKTGQTPYFFNVRWSGGGGTLVGMTERKPTYAEAASIVKQSMAGKKVGPSIKLP